MCSSTRKVSASRYFSIYKPENYPLEAAWQPGAGAAMALRRNGRSSWFNAMSRVDSSRAKAREDYGVTIAADGIGYRRMTDEA